MAAAPFYMSPGSSWGPITDGAALCAVNGNHQRGAPPEPSAAGRVGKRRSKGAEGGIFTPECSDRSGLCDDAAQYLGKDAFFNLK